MPRVVFFPLHSEKQKLLSLSCDCRAQEEIHRPLRHRVRKPCSVWQSRCFQTCLCFPSEERSIGDGKLVMIPQKFNWYTAKYPGLYELVSSVHYGLKWQTRLDQELFTCVTRFSLALRDQRMATGGSELIKKSMTY